MTEKLSISPGNRLYHNTAHPVNQFNPEKSNVLFFGLTKESIKAVGGEGYCVTYVLMDWLRVLDEYGSRFACGQWGDWLSLPCEIAAEILIYEEAEELA